MLVQEGTDMKEWIRNLDDFKDIESNEKWRIIRDSWVDRVGARRELHTRTTLARFDWDKLNNVSPDREIEAYHESTLGTKQDILILSIGFLMMQILRLI